MNSFRACSDTFEVPTMEEINIKENDNDTVLNNNNNINSMCKSSARNTLPSVKSDSGKHSVVIVGDRHTRVCASRIKDILNKNFSVTGFVNPGSNTFTLANSAKETIGNLTKKLCFSILGGGGINDIDKNC